MTLSQFFREHPRAAIAFSGGVDSAYLLYAAVQAGAQVSVYYVKSPFQPAFELEDAKKLASRLGVALTVLPLDVLEDPCIAGNPADRCYFCKKKIFSAIARQATLDGCTVLLDGTNASDQEDDRPGFRALRELSVRSPLREAGLTKDEIRRLSKDAGLFTWDKPAYACLATRIPTGEPITPGKLDAVEQGENYLMELGFRDFRLRTQGSTAKLQLREADLPLLLEHRQEILARLKEKYHSIVLDLETRQ